MRRRQTRKIHTVRIRAGFLRAVGTVAASVAVLLLAGGTGRPRTELLVAGFLHDVPALGGGQTVSAAEDAWERGARLTLWSASPLLSPDVGGAIAPSGDSVRVKREDQPPAATAPAAPNYFQSQDGKTVKEADLGADGISLRNETDYDVDVDALLSADLEFDLSTGGPKVLVVHTHTSESYAPSALYPYEPTDNVRTEDNRFNVTQVGKAVAEALRREGVETIHDDSLNDYPSYNGSYVKTLGVIQEHLSQTPTIEIVLDVHRDYTEQDDGVQLKPTLDVDGAPCAQMMFVVGTDAMGLDHENWRHNLSFALRVNQKLNETVPRLVRCVNIRNERFNQHATKGSLILEMGSQANTLEEAIRTGTYVGQAIASVLKGR